jgi:hypothetical protein
MGKPVTALLLFVLTVVSRLPFTSRVLYNWDSVQYALGTENFNVAYHQPHPPGYILYVAAGRALNSLTANANQSFIIVSILASGLAVAALYLFALRAMGRRNAVYVALLLLLNPVFWFYGEITSTYAIECLMAIMIGWACFRVRDGEAHLAPWVGFLIAIAAGIRQTTALLLLPLVVFSLRRAPARRLLAAAVVLVALTLAWLLPLLHYSGGLEAYLEATRQMSRIDTWRWPVYGIAVGLRNVAALAAATGVGLHILVPIAVAFLFHFFPLADRRADWERWFVFWWIAPAVLLYSLHYGQPGYVLLYLPVILLYLPSLIRGFLEDLKLRIHRDTGRTVGFSTQRGILTMLTIVGIVNTALFLWAPWEPSARSIAIHDREWQAILSLKDDFPAENSIVLTEFFATGSFRHASYYLPRYMVYCLGADRDVGVYGWLFRTRDRQPSYNLSHIELHERIELPSRIRYVLILDRSVADACDMPLREIALTPGSSAYVLSLGGSASADSLVIQDHRLRLK